ncbi:uncharacterized protein LOC141541338 [Sminthopsis crassicaudata]|uniref:uncharacterized protein LOC141541338 n=1 Tax=Sminthopsis crassicaudata TaxID=9301 RepID=UPI003D68A9DC
MKTVSQLKIKHNPFAKGFREKYYFGNLANQYLASKGSTARTTNSPENDFNDSSKELGEGSSQDNEKSEEGSKKRGFSPHDSEDGMCSRGKRRKQHAGCLTSLEFSTPRISTENASSVSIAGQGEGACQVIDEIPVTPGFLPQVPRELTDFACGAIHGSNNLQPLATDGMNPSICPPTRPFDSRQDVVDLPGDWSSFSSANSNMNSGSWPQSIPDIAMAPFTGTQEEMDRERRLLAELSTLQSLDPGWVEEIAKWRNLPQ